MIKVKKGVTTYLVRFSDGDEIAYLINWDTGLSLLHGAVGAELVEVMGRAL